MSKRLLQLATLSVFAACALWAQQDRGTFVGTVTDASGAVVPGVKVIAVQTTTNATSETVTNDSGSYRFPNLPIGDYRIEVEAQGFKKSVRDGIRLNVTNVLRVDFVLEVGATSESITVTGQVPLLVTDNPEVGTLNGHFEGRSADSSRVELDVGHFGRRVDVDTAHTSETRDRPLDGQRSTATTGEAENRKDESLDVAVCRGHAHRPCLSRLSVIHIVRRVVEHCLRCG
mgnify:CR=1 FL=1